MARAPVSEPIDVRLVDLAAEHVRRYGLRRTTIVGIAQEAGMSHANVYRYFPSKEALIDAVLDQWLKPIEKGARDIADGPDPAVDKLERLASAVFRAYRRKLDEDTAIFQIFAEASAAGRPIARRHRNRIGAEFHRVVEEGTSGGSFQVGDQRGAVFLLADALGRFLNPVNVALDREVPASQLENRMDQIVRILLNAFTGGQLASQKIGDNLQYL